MKSSLDILILMVRIFLGAVFGLIAYKLTRDWWLALIAAATVGAMTDILKRE